MAQSSTSLSRFLGAGLVAGFASVVVNAAIYLLASVAGAWDLSVISPAGSPITVVPVIILSLVPAVLGALLAGILMRRSAQGRAWFLGIAFVVLVFMAFPPLGLGAPFVMMLLLQLQHVVVAAFTLWFVLRVA